MIGVFRDADALYIFGPGEDKGELRREIESLLYQPVIKKTRKLAKVWGE